MPVPTTPWQPVIYDAMLLANSVLSLRRIGRVSRHSSKYCEHEKNLITALSRIRNLAQFLSATGQDDLIKATDAEFGGQADTRYIAGDFDRVSKYVSHLHEQRYKKEKRFRRPNAEDACQAAKTILPAVKAILEPIENKFAGDAARWYGVFKQTAADFYATYDSSS